MRKRGKQVSDETRTAAQAVAAVIEGRRAVQLFDAEKKVPAALVRRAVDLARWAPNHKLTQPWRFYLLGPETARGIAHLNAALVRAKQGDGAAENKLARWLGIPGWLLVTHTRTDDAFRSQEDYAACACAVQNLQLYLWSEGVGTKWTTGAVTRDARFFDLVGVDPAAESVVGLLWYGYPAALPTPPPRRPVEDVLFERP